VLDIEPAQRQERVLGGVFMLVYSHVYGHGARWQSPGTALARLLPTLSIQSSESRSGREPTMVGRVSTLRMDQEQGSGGGMHDHAAAGRYSLLTLSTTSGCKRALVYKAAKP
jgi:hypothetical protein